MDSAGLQTKHRMSWHLLGCFHETFPCKCSVGWSTWGCSLRCSLQFTHPVLASLSTLPWHLWPWSKDDLFCPCHGLVLNTNAMVLCAPPFMGTNSAIFSRMSPAAHLQPGANGQLVVFFLMAGGSAVTSPTPTDIWTKALSVLPCNPAARHYSESHVVIAIHLNLHRCAETLLSNICCQQTDLLASSSIQIHVVG